MNIPIIPEGITCTAAAGLPTSQWHARLFPQQQPQQLLLLSPCQAHQEQQQGQQTNLSNGQLAPSALW
jgi:hypothetical protein